MVKSAISSKMDDVKYSQWVLERVAVDEVIRLCEGVTTLGRTPDCTIRSFSTFSSRMHCKFNVSPDGRITVEDFSSNGTFVNTQPHIHKVVELAEGDRIGIGCEASDEDCATGIYCIYILRKMPMSTNVMLEENNKSVSENGHIEALPAGIKAISLS